MPRITSCCTPKLILQQTHALLEKKNVTDAEPTASPYSRTTSELAGG